MLGLIALGGYAGAVAAVGLGALTFGAVAGALLGAAFVVSFVDLITPEAEAEIKGVLTTRKGAVQPLNVVYGAREAAGGQIFLASSDKSVPADPPRYETRLVSYEGGDTIIEQSVNVFAGTPAYTLPNAYRWVVYQLADGDVPIENLKTVYINDEPLVGSKYENYVEYQFTNGSHTSQPFADLEAATTTPAWTSQHLVLGTVAIAIRMEWNKDVFEGVPKFTFFLGGNKVLDLDELLKPLENSLIYNNVSEYDRDLFDLSGDGSEWEVDFSPNLLSYSEEFDNSDWNKNGSHTITPNAIAAPDGSITADLITDTDTDAGRFFIQNIVPSDNDSLSKTFSIHLKEGSAATTLLAIYFTGGTTTSNAMYITWADHSITDGTLESVGDGWYRASISLANNSSGTTHVRGRVWPSSNSAGDTGSVYLWGGQLEPGSVATAYKNSTPNTIALASGVVAAGPTRRNFVYFNGTDAYMQLESTWSAAGSFEAEVYFSIEAAATDSYPTLLRSSDITSGLTLYINESNGRVSLRLNNGSGGYVFQSATTNVIDGNFHTAKIQYVHSTTTYTLFIDGTDEGSIVEADADNNIYRIGEGISDFDGIIANLKLTDLEIPSNRLEFLIDEPVNNSELPIVTAPTQTRRYSNNPAEVQFDYLINPIYGKGLSLIDGVDLDVASFIAARDYANDSVTSYSGGPSHSRMSCNAILTAGSTVMDNMRKLLVGCRGTLPYINGIFNLMIERDYAYTEYKDGEGSDYSEFFDFNEDNIIGSWKIKAGDIGTRYNQVKVIFPNEEKHFESDFVTVYSNTFRAEDGRLLEKTFTLTSVTNAYQATDTANVIMRKSRQQIAASFMATPRARNVTAGEIVTISHGTPAWNLKKFRVSSIVLLSTGNCGVTVAEHEPTVYDLTAPNEIETSPDTDFPDPTIVASLAAPTLISDETVLKLGNDGTLTPQLRITWLAPADVFVVGYDVQIKDMSSTDLIWQTVASPTSIDSVVVTIAGVEEGIAYDVRVRARNSGDWVGAWAVTENHTIVGKTSPPASVSAITSTLNKDNITLSWTANTELDLSGYEIRVGGSAWGVGDEFVAEISSTQIIVPPIAAGSTIFRIKAIDTGRRKSENALELTVQVVAPTAPNVSFEIKGPNAIIEWEVPTSDFTVLTYNLSYTHPINGLIDLGSTDATINVFKVDFGGAATFRVSAVDLAGNVGAEGTEIVVISLPVSVPIIPQVIDNNILLRWGDMSNTLPIANHEIRKGATYAAPDDISFVTGTFAALFETASGDYTYWVTGIDTAGNYGANSQVTASINQPPDYVLQSDNLDDFSGSKTKFLLDNGRLLAPVNTTETWEEHYVDNGWSTAQDQIDAGLPIYIQPTEVGDSTYERIFDLGALLANLIVNLTVTSLAIDGDPTMTRQLFTSVDGSTYTPYTIDQNQVFVASFRYVKVKLVVTADTTDDLLEISSIRVLVNVKKISDSGRVTISSTGGTTVTFNKSFVDIDSIQVSAIVSGTGFAPLTAIADFVDSGNPTEMDVFLFNTETGVEQSSGVVGWDVTGK
jgi:hypothetical protein